jgi:2-oxoglutarate dehydrogenase E2 component (dihydrolipoamide succinyltransferase)
MTPLQTIARRLVEPSHRGDLTTFNGRHERRDGAAFAIQRSFAEARRVAGFMSFFSRACVLALQEIREVSAGRGRETVYNNRVHLGIAASTEKGLVVPVVRDADRLDLAGLEREIGRLADLARTNKLMIADLSGGTFRSPTVACSARCCPRRSSTRRRAGSWASTPFRTAPWLATARSSSAR